MRNGIGYCAAVEIEFDPAKDVANVEKHGMSLAKVGELEIFAVTEKSRPRKGNAAFGFMG